MRNKSDQIRINGKRVTGMKWIFLFIASFCPFYAAVAMAYETQQKTVVIDAGHGGKDPGTVVGLAKEKHVVLDIALKLGNLIKQNQKKIKIVYTRDKDFYVPLMDRAQIANKLNADLFISIHANYCENPNINGTETYVLGLHRTEDNLNVAKKENSVILLEEDYSNRYEGFNPKLSESYIMFELIQDAYLDQSLRFATILQSNFKELAQRHDREVRQAGFLVLRETAMPSVLIETGYLSNKKENCFLLTDAGRSEIAQSIYGSLIDYLNKLDSKDNQPVKSEKGIKTDNDANSRSMKEMKPKEKIQSEFVEPKDNAVAKGIKPSVHKKQKEKKDLPIQTKSIENKAINNRKIDNGDMFYAIQIGVYSKKIALDSKIFKGLAPIKELKIDRMYKYFCFESESFQATKSNFNVVSKYFPDAFIVSIQNNETKMVWKNNGKK